MAHRIKASGEDTGKERRRIKSAGEKPEMRHWRPGEMDDRGLSPDFERGAEKDHDGNVRRH
jgi:hypothetical protein